MLVMVSMLYTNYWSPLKHAHYNPVVNHSGSLTVLTRQKYYSAILLTTIVQPRRDFRNICLHFSSSFRSKICKRSEIRTPGHPVRRNSRPLQWPRPFAGSRCRSMAADTQGWPRIVLDIWMPWLVRVHDIPWSIWIILRWLLKVVNH